MTVHDFRRLALSLPEAIEADHFGAPSFRVRGKIFAQVSNGGDRAIVKLPREIQASVMASYPLACTSEPHWGRFGWTSLNLAALPADLVADLILGSWRAVASKTLHRAIPAPA